MAAKSVNLGNDSHEKEQIICFRNQAETGLRIEELLAEAHLEFHALNTVFGVKRELHQPGAPRCR